MFRGMAFQVILAVSMLIRTAVVLSILRMVKLSAKLSASHSKECTAESVCNYL